MLNYIKNGFKRIQTLNTHGGQFKSNTPESRMQNKALTCGFVFRLDKHGTLMARAFKGSPRAALRLARGVAVAIGIALCSATPAGMAQQMPTLGPIRYSIFLVGEVEASCLWKIARKESNIRFDAINKQSGAVGAWQFMNPKLANKTPNQQLELAVKYSIHRYGSPCEAWEFWKRNYWW